MCDKVYVITNTKKMTIFDSIGNAVKSVTKPIGNAVKSVTKPLGKVAKTVGNVAEKGADKLLHKMDKIDKLQDEAMENMGKGLNGLGSLFSSPLMWLFIIVIGLIIAKMVFDYKKNK